MFGPSPSGQRSTCSVHHQYSSRRLALPGVDRDAGRGVGGASGPTTIAAAAWSWVEKMLQDAQRTCAPSATSVSMSTAVWMVMCSEPVIRAPASGWLAAYSRADRHQAGHLVLGELDLLAAELGERQVRDLEVALGERRAAGAAGRADGGGEGAGHECSCRTGCCADLPPYAPGAAHGAVGRERSPYRRPRGYRRMAARSRTRRDDAAYSYRYDAPESAAGNLGMRPALRPAAPER